MKVTINQEHEIDAILINEQLIRDNGNLSFHLKITSDKDYSLSDLSYLFDGITSVVVEKTEEGRTITQDYSMYHSVDRIDKKTVDQGPMSIVIDLVK